MEVIGKVLGINTSDGLINLLIVDKEDNQWNIKTENNGFLVGYIYQFDVEKVFGERVSYNLISWQKIDNLDDDKCNEIYRSFLPSSPVSMAELKNYIYAKANSLDNLIIKQITLNILEKYEKQYFVYPAATRMHHAYVGGLAYHCYGMLKVADTFILNYPYLNKDYLYAGIILHDIGKVSELPGVQGTEYTLDGQLLGHLVIGALEINHMAIKLGYETTKEAKFLEHMLISHHGQLQFGAARRPITPEAIALWYIDTIDSKFRVLGEELAKTASNSFTETIGVLDKVKVYKE